MRFERLRDVSRSLRFRLTIWNTLVVALTVVITLVCVHIGLQYTLRREMDQLLREDALEMALSVERFHPNREQILGEMNRKAIGHEYRDLFVRLLDAQGRVLMQNDSAPEAEELNLTTASADALDPNHPQFEPLTSGDFRIAQAAVGKADPPKMFVRVGSSMRHMNEDVAALSRLLVLTGLTLLVASPVGGYWLAGRATQPLGQIIKTAADLRPAKLDDRLPLRNTGDELDQLSATINRLLDRIANYLEQNRSFIDNAAHELRSPLAAVQSAVEVALNSDRSTQEYKELLYDIFEQCSHLGTLVNQLLLLAETDNAALPLVRETVRLDRVVGRSLDMFQGVAEEKRVSLLAKNLEAVAVLGDATRLRQVVNNLLDNALKYTPAGGRVSVDLQTDVETRRVRLRVVDTGPGIAAADLPRVFERFYRGDKSRHREGEFRGNGLGLSICQAVVAAHGGEISVKNEPEGGAAFSVYLPELTQEPAVAAPLPVHAFTP